MSVTDTILERYVSAFNVDAYKVQVKSRLTEDGFWCDYTPAQLLRAVSFLRRQNAHGFDIYCRPIGYEFVLLDDLTGDVLADVATLKPCLLMETSPANYQAWLILPEVPADRDRAKAICRELAIRFGADLASAEPDHVGRLPGFTNRKEKHRMPNGLFPFVKLHRSEHRHSTFYPFGGAVLHTPAVSATTGIQPHSGPSKSSNSEQDFGIACWLIRQGKNDEQIYQHLLSTSIDVAARKGSKHVKVYLERTIRNAHRSVPP